MNYRNIIYTIAIFVLTLSSAYSQVNMSWDWVRTAGGSLTQKATSIALDHNDVIIAGTFTSSFISLGSNNVLLINNDSMSSPNHFIAKYNQNGEVAWAKKTICNLGITSNKIVTDDNGNIYACGFISSNNSIHTISFDGITNYVHTGGRSFITKYSPQGITQWVMFIKNKFWGYDSIASIKWDQKTNAIVFAGYCQGDTINIGGETIINSGNSLHTSFIGKLELQQGNVTWLKSTKANSFINKINEISIDTSGAIYTAASFLGNSLVLSSNDTLINSSSSSGALIYDGYFAKYNQNGILQWFKKGICTTNDEITTINCLNNNHLLMGGYNNSLFSINGTALNGTNFMLEYDAQGNYLNAINFPATIKTINALKQGNGFIVAGIFSSDSLVLGNTILNNSGNPGSLNSNIFITRSDNFGIYNAAIAAGGAASSFINSLTISDSNEIYACGSFNQPSVKFGTIQYNANGITDLFLLKSDAGFLPPIPLKYNLGGTVFAGLMPVDHAIVYLLDLSQHIIDSCLADTMGFYHFYQKPSGSYKLKAEVAYNSMYYNQNYIISFYPDKTSFNEAISILLNMNKWGKDIELQKANNINENDMRLTKLSISKLFPNPAKNKINIFVNSVISDDYTVDIINTNGQIVFSQTFYKNLYNAQIQINISLLNNGLYQIVIMNHKGEITNSRFVKTE